MKTLRIGLIALAVFAIVSVNLQAQVKEIPVTTTSEEAQKLFQDGMNKADYGDWLASSRLFDKAIQKDAGFALAYLYRSQAGGGYNIYRQSLDKAISLAGKVSEGEKLLIQYYQASADGNGKGQKEYLYKLLELFPSDKRVLLLAGAYYQGNGELEDALKFYQKVTEVDKNFAPVYNNLGYLQSALSNYSESEKAFKNYIKLIPDRPDPHDSYGELLLKMGKFDASIAEYKKAFNLDSLNYAGALNGIGNNYLFSGDYETARKYYQRSYSKATDIDNKTNALYLKATSYAFEGLAEKAVAALDEIRLMAENGKQIPWAIWAYNAQGYVYAELVKPAEAGKYFNKANQIMAQSKLPDTDMENMKVTSLFWNVYLLLLKNETDKAATELEKLKQKIESRQNPVEIKELNLLIGLSEMKKANFDKAINCLAKADTLNPVNWYYSAVNYDKKGDRKSALKFFNKIANYNVISLDLALVIRRAKAELNK